MKNKIFNHIKILSIISFTLLFFIIIFYFVNESLKDKDKTRSEYDNKIVEIEKQARLYGLNNRSSLIKGKLPIDNDESTITITSYDKDGKIKTLSYNTNKKYNASEKLGNNEYRGTRIFIKDLVKEGYLTWDEVDSCSNCAIENKEYYNNIVINPINKSIINGCYVYIYYKDSDVYAHFDKYLCDQTQNDKSFNGQEYKSSKY